ncbi:DUF4097 family beta strand repeat-containing protein [Ureibacillus sinduriensis]|uniref:DUF4097 family beta strand repeat-containing protein n=1 Tax=Ureibacillus sinduriensis TaxID=561440 RepID=UPI00068BA018|nr:DUF4097 family beta strand repeat-containing protein [Ureibacillus sinduriensis]
MEKKKVFIWVALIAIIAVIVFQVLNNGEEGDVTIDKDFSHVEVESDNADIMIMPIEDDQASIELDRNDNNRYKLDVEVKDETLEIRVERKGFKWLSFGFFSKKPVVMVGLPKKDYGTIIAETDNGTINVNQTSVRELMTYTDNGDVMIEGTDSKEVLAESDNGNITIKNISSQDIFVEIDNGDTVIEDSKGRIEAESSNGMLTVITDKIEQPMELVTDNGEILVETEDKSDNVRFEVKTDNGKINIYGQTITDAVNGKGEIAVKLVSDNGSITVE